MKIAAIWLNQTPISSATLKLFCALNVVLLLALLFTIGAARSAFGQAALGDLKIGSCGCDQSCFTDEVKNLRCTPTQYRFESSGLPDETHVMMRGITATNQQYPSTHAYEITIPLNQRMAATPTPTVPGAIGIAVNGVPLFDPGTQGKIDPNTGRSPHTYDVGELDECGGHAGRGDDYHYHIAPKCLIDELGETHVEDHLQPIGFANDGFPILAVGWFRQDRNLEAHLDECRGMEDRDGDYFYNVEAASNWDILTCFKGKAVGISKDRWDQRYDMYGAKIVGAKVSMAISSYRLERYANNLCHIMEGTLDNQRVLTQGTNIEKLSSKGAIFYCNPNCYSEFFSPQSKSEYRGPVVFYEQTLVGCPTGFSPEALPLFAPYEGAKLQKKSAK